jgi:hypothetical protein
MRYLHHPSIDPIREMTPAIPTTINEMNAKKFWVALFSRLNLFVPNVEINFSTKLFRFLEALLRDRLTGRIALLGG